MSDAAHRVPQPGRMPPEVGVVLLGHGTSASSLLAAARSVVGEGSLADVRAFDAGAGMTGELREELRKVIVSANTGRGVLLITDVLGSSPCSCAREFVQEAGGTVATGLNLAMLLKLAFLARSQLSPSELAKACVDASHRATCMLFPEGTNA